jgi:hypothetical protein
MGVGALVVDDEAGVDVGRAAVRSGQLVGVGVPAEAAVGLEERDFVVALQQVGGGQAGDAGADDGDTAATLRRLRRGSGGSRSWVGSRSRSGGIAERARSRSEFGA